MPMQIPRNMLGTPPRPFDQSGIIDRRNELQQRGRDTRKSQQDFDIGQQTLQKGRQQIGKGEREKQRDIARKKLDDMKPIINASFALMQRYKKRLKEMGDEMKAIAATQPEYEEELRQLQKKGLLPNASPNFDPKATQTMLDTYTSAKDQIASVAKDKAVRGDKKIGSAKETVLWKMLDGKPLNEGDRKVLNISTKEEATVLKNALALLRNDRKFERGSLEEKKTRLEKVLALVREVMGSPQPVEGTTSGDLEYNFDFKGGRIVPKGQ